MSRPGRHVIPPGRRMGRAYGVSYVLIPVRRARPEDARDRHGRCPDVERRRRRRRCHEPPDDQGLREHDDQGSSHERLPRRRRGAHRTRSTASGRPTRSPGRRATPARPALRVPLGQPVPPGLPGRPARRALLEHRVRRVPMEPREALRARPVPTAPWGRRARREPMGLPGHRVRLAPMGRRGHRVRPVRRASRATPATPAPPAPPAPRAPRATLAPPAPPEPPGRSRA